MHTVQYGLLKILCRTLAALRHFTPDVCQILLDQVPLACARRTLLLRAQLLSPSVLLFLELSCLLGSPWTWPSTTSCLP